MNSRARVAIVLFSTAMVMLVLIGGLLGKSTSSEGAYKQLAVYSEVLGRIRTDYVEEPDLRAVTAGALHGLLESLDPFSSYLSPQEYERYQRQRNTGRADLGLVYSKRFGYVSIITAIPGGPAAKAGLANGDIVESLNGKTTRDMSLEEVRSMMVGTPGSELTLTVVRVRRGEPQRLTLKREVVQPPAIAQRVLEPGIGYLEVESFPNGRAREIAARATQLISGGARRLVIDLRNAADGDISEGIAAANLFLDHGVITYLQGQRHPRENFNAVAAQASIRVPVVLLVNRATAGPAEVMSAAILENGRGDVVGEKTYGVGSVQRLIPLDDGSAIILSVAKYYTPGGKAIQDNGVTPNVLMADAQADDAAVLEEEEAPEPQPQPQTPREDTVLKRAIEVLKAQAEKRPAA